MSAPAALRVGVLALQGAVAEHVSMLRGLGVDAAPVRRAGELGGLDGLVVPGGESTAMARIAQPSGLLPAVRAAMDAGLPVMGTCAGAILLADTVADAGALERFDRIGGLDIRVRRNAFGNQLGSFETAIQVPALGSTMRAVFIRAPVIDWAGPGVEVLARLPDFEGDAGGAGDRGSRPAAIVAVRQGRNVAASFHPELSGDDRLHRLFVAGLTAR